MQIYVANFIFCLCMLFVSLINSYSCDVGKGQTTINKNQILQKVAHKKALVFPSILLFTYLCPKSS